jgi:excisionase family DNA binding protein
MPDATPGDILQLMQIPVLTVEQAAAVLAVPVATVENQQRVGALQAVLLGKHRRYRPADLLAYVAGLGGDA